MIGIVGLAALVALIVLMRPRAKAPVPSEFKTKGADRLAGFGRFDEAARLAMRENNWDEAIALYSRAQQPANAAHAARRKGDLLLAAQLFETAGDKEQAASCRKRAEERKNAQMAAAAPPSDPEPRSSSASAPSGPPSEPSQAPLVAPDLDAPSHDEHAPLSLPPLTLPSSAPPPDDDDEDELAPPPPRPASSPMPQTSDAPRGLGASGAPRGPGLFSGAGRQQTPVAPSPATASPATASPATASQGASEAALELSLPPDDPDWYEPFGAAIASDRPGQRAVDALAIALEKADQGALGVEEEEAPASDSLPPAASERRRSGQSPRVELEDHGGEAASKSLAALKASGLSARPVRGHASGGYSFVQGKTSQALDETPPSSAGKKRSALPSSSRAPKSGAAPKGAAKSGAAPKSSPASKSITAPKSSAPPKSVLSRGELEILAREIARTAPRAAPASQRPSIDWLQQMIGGQPCDLANIEVYYRLGVAYAAGGLWDLALDAFLAVEEGSPGYRDAHRRAGAMRAWQEEIGPWRLGFGEELEGGARYALLGEIDRGESAILYRAHDRKLGRDVAVRMTSEPIDRAARATWEREAGRAEALAHPQIASVYGHGLLDGRAFLASELVEGSSVETLRGELSLEDGLVIGVEALRALAHAHSHGVVHGALQPSALLRESDGAIKLVGFGLSSLPRDDDATAAGAPFLAPEQLSGREVDARADIFAAGAILYVLLTHELPYAGVDRSRMPRSTSTHVPAIPGVIDQAIRKALDPDVKARHATAADFAEPIEKVLKALREHLAGS